MKIEYRQAFREVNLIIQLMPSKLVGKISKEFLEVLSNEEDKTYNPYIKEPIEECNLKLETIALLGLIYRDFLSSDAKKKSLQEKDLLEFMELQKKESANMDQLFTKRNESTKVEEKSLTVIKKLAWYEKIISALQKLNIKGKK